MDRETAISVSHVSKSFRIFLDKGVYLKERVLFRSRNRYEDRKVLKDISFQVRKGEAIGLVGENGCGKSTTLKLLSRIMYPDQGEVVMNGRVSALIELGAGFHPDLSGRENIYTNAAIFGLNRPEIDRRLQTIIDFSELGEYIDNPVRTYSSGMYMRLAFSVAINVDADILLIDEILAVGDVAFQAKCFNKLREIKRNGTTIVIVSHSLGQIEQICDRSYWIEKGLIREQGAPMDVHQSYLRYMSERSGTLSENERGGGEKKNPEAEKGSGEVGETDREEERRWGSGDAHIRSVDILDRDGRETDRLKSGEPFKIRIRYEAKEDLEEAAFGIAIFRNDGLQCYGTNTHIDHKKIALPKGEGEIVFSALNNDLLEGAYLLDAAIHKPDGFAYDYYRKCRTFVVTSPVKDGGVMRINHAWEINGERM